MTKRKGTRTSFEETFNFPPPDHFDSKLILVISKLVFLLSFSKTIWLLLDYTTAAASSQVRFDFVGPTRIFKPKQHDGHWVRLRSPQSLSLFFLILLPFAHLDCFLAFFVFFFFSSGRLPKIHNWQHTNLHRVAFVVGCWVRLGISCLNVVPCGGSFKIKI